MQRGSNLRHSTTMQGSANAELFEGLLMLQHRGQDSAGMVTYDGHRFCEHKDNGLVNDVFGARTMKQLRGGTPAPHPTLDQSHTA